MKRRFLILLSILIASSFIIKAQEKIKIGVYDSRAIAICYFRSTEFSKEMRSLMEQRKEALKDSDSVKAKELEEKGILLQRIAHDKGFGTGSVAEILEKYKVEIEKLAKENNLVVVLSKWELNYSDPNIELVDITLQMMDLFGADDNLKKMYKQMKEMDPVKDAMFLNPLE